jgi:nucleoside-diphosphate-sugar epimerase
MALGRLAQVFRPAASADAPLVLITGAGGLIGRILRDGLRRDFRLRGLDIRSGDGVDVVADSTDAEAIRPAFDGVDAVVDLAADPAADAPWDVVRANNIPATLNALEAARVAGARRFVFASSNHVTGLYENDEPYASIVAGEYERVPSGFERLTSRSPIRPDGPYGVGKALGEAAARFYAEEQGVSAVCLRIGTVNEEGRPLSPRQFATLLTHRDLVELVRRALVAPTEFAIVYGVSANRWRFWDTDEARAAIGYEPRDDAERWR